MNKLMQTVTENVAYVVIFLAVIVGCFLVAVALEKGAQKKNGISEPIFNTRKTLLNGKKKMEKDNFNVVHIIKERGVCPDISLFLFASKKNEL